MSTTRSAACPSSLAANRSRAASRTCSVGPDRVEVGPGADGRHRRGELGDGARRRPREAAEVEVDAPLARIGLLVGSEEDDGATGAEEVEEDAAVVADEDVGDAEHLVGRHLVGDEHPGELRVPGRGGIHLLVDLEQHPVPVRQEPTQLAHPLAEDLGVVARGREGLALPGRGVEDDPVSVGEDEAGPAQAGTHPLASGRVEDLPVGPWPALVDDLAGEDVAEAVAALVHVPGHVVAARQHVVGHEQVADDVAGGDDPVGLVVAHRLQRGPVPRVEVDLPGALAEAGPERRVVDEPPRRREVPDVCRGAGPDDGDPRVGGELPAGLGRRRLGGQHPDVPEVGEVRGVQHGPEDGLRVAEGTPSAVGLVEDDVVADRQAGREVTKLEGDGGAHLGRDEVGPAQQSTQSGHQRLSP